MNQSVLDIRLSIGLLKVVVKISRKNIFPAYIFTTTFSKPKDSPITARTD